MSVLDEAFRLAMQHSSIGMCRVAPDGAFLEVNPALCSMLGRDEVDLCNCSWQQLTHPDDLAADSALVADVLAGRRDAYTLAKRYLRPDGSVVHGELSVVGIRQHDGSVEHFISQIVDVTDLVELRQRYQMVAESVSDVVVLSDGSGRVSWTLPSVHQALGWSPQELVGTDFAALVHSDDLDAVRSVQAGAINDGAGSVEVRLRNNAGRYRWMKLRMRPIVDDRGAIIGSIASGWDVHGEHEVRSALARTTERYRVAIESELDPHVFLEAVRDREGSIVDFTFVDANRRAEDYFGRSMSDLQTRSLLGDYPTSRSLVERFIHTVDTGEALRIDEFHMRSSLAGPNRYFDFRGTKVGDGLSLTWRDVTDRVDAALALAESESHYRLLAENASDVVFRGSPEAILLWASPSIQDVLGKPAEAYIGKPVASFIHPDDVQNMRAASEQVNTGERVSYRARVDSAIGWRWTEVTAKPVYDSNGTVIARVGSVRDVHAQVLAELALAQSEASARDLADRYEIARDAAERASNQKTSFLSRMSHELRTPLNAVLGFGQLLEVEDLTGSQRESLDQILIGGRHLLGLINEILDISRIESGRMSLSLESVSVADAVREAISLVAPAAANGDVRLGDVDGEACTAYVRADRQRLNQVLLNLLTNAIKYNRPGGQAWVTCAPGKDDLFTLSVHDTGVGMSETQLQRLFQPFDRLGAEATEIEGTGIGLSLAQGLVGLMGGGITAVSTPGVGSVFTVTLPRDVAPNDPLGPKAEDAESTQRRHTRALYVEDNPANRLLMQRIFAHRPECDLELASTGNGGLAAALDRTPDLILLDLHLPDLAGDDVLVRLRDDPRTRDIPVLVITADAATSVRRRLRSLGAADVLTKPVVVRDVLAWIDDPRRQVQHE